MKPKDDYTSCAAYQEDGGNTRRQGIVWHVREDKGNLRRQGVRVYSLVT